MKTLCSVKGRHKIAHCIESTETFVPGFTITSYGKTQMNIFTYPIYESTDIKWSEKTNPQ